MSSAGYAFGDVVLVPFPFTNQVDFKKRPAVIVSGADYNRVRPDLVVMAVTSQLRPSGLPDDVWIGRWQDAGLLKPSAIKPVFATLEQSLVLRRLGILSMEDQALLRTLMRRILA